MTLTSENKRGSDCTGTNGQTNRVLTLANTMVTASGGFSVYVNGLNLVLTTEYTVSHLTANSTVTFLNIVWDTDYITVIYNQSGGTPAASNYATTTDVYNRSGLSTTEVSAALMEELIIDAEAELEMLTGMKWTNANSATEYISIKDKDVIGNYQTNFLVSHWPIQSITLFNVVDDEGNAISTYDTLSSAEIVAETYESDDYWLEVMNDPTDNNIHTTGRITLKTETFPKGINNVKITYTYGYSSVPRIITELVSCMAGINGWVSFLGGQYSNAGNYSLSEFSMSRGDVYQRGLQNITAMQGRVDTLLDRIGRKSRVMFFASGDAR